MGEVSAYNYERPKSRNPLEAALRRYNLQRYSVLRTSTITCMSSHCLISSTLYLYVQPDLMEVLLRYLLWYVPDCYGAWNLEPEPIESAQWLPTSPGLLGSPRYK